MPRIHRSDFRLFLFGVTMLVALSAIVLRLWVLQVMRGEVYAKRVGSSRQVTVRIPSVRGEILDRNGLPLVQNRASYNVDFYLPDMVHGYRERNDGKVPTRKVRRTIRNMPKDVNSTDVVQVVNSGVIPRLQDLDLAQDYNARQLQRHYDGMSLVPFTYIEDIDFPTIARFSEHDVGLPGVSVSVKPVRQYRYGALAAHLLGHVGLPNDPQALPDFRTFNFYQSDVEGKNHIERAMDPYLRGEPGVRVIRKTARGALDGIVREDAPKPGANVTLTLDARVQYIAELALRHPNIGRAAAVVVDPNTGEVLAMASVPSFDPNVFIPSVSLANWNALTKDPAVPLVNRAVSGFPPGSTFKVITALAGMKEGLNERKFNCPGGVQYGNHYFRCWISGKGQHGTLNCSDAMKVSCNSFFYQMANAAGGGAMEETGALLGIGRRNPQLGLSDERPGIMPGPTQLQQSSPNARWTQASSAQTSIGQGGVLATPLQMAMVYAAIANGGTVYEPRLIKSIATPDGRPALNSEGQVAFPDQPIIRSNLLDHISQEDMDSLRRSLWKVVNQVGGPGGSGTGGRGKAKGTEVAGKTGTAQASDRGKAGNIAWFCAFAPYDKPRYAVAVMVQDGTGGGGKVAAPVAAQILEQCVALDQGKITVDVRPLAPARKRDIFATIEEINYSGVKLEAVESDSIQVSEAANAQVESSTATPDIRAESDEEGRVAPRQPSQRARRAQPANQQRATSGEARRAQPAGRGENRERRPRRAADREQQREEPQRRGNIFQRFFQQDRRQAPPPAQPRRERRP